MSSRSPKSAERAHEIARSFEFVFFSHYFVHIFASRTISLVLFFHYEYTCCRKKVHLLQETEV